MLKLAMGKEPAGVMSFEWYWGGRGMAELVAGQERWDVRLRCCMFAHPVDVPFTFFIRASKLIQILLIACYAGEIQIGRKPPVVQQSCLRDVFEWHSDILFGDSKYAQHEQLVSGVGV